MLISAAFNLGSLSRRRGRRPLSENIALTIVRTLIDYFPVSSRELQMKVLSENIEWARNEKRVFLRQSLEIRLVGL